MHVAVALGEIGGGVADPPAAVGEGGGDVVDRAAEAPGEEAAAGKMQPRLGLAPALIDHQRIGLDHRAAQGVGGSGKLGEGTAGLLGDEGVAVAAGDAGRDLGQQAHRALDGEGGDQAGDAAGDRPDHRAAGHGGEHGDQAGGRAPAALPRRSARSREVDVGMKSPGFGRP